MTTSRTSVYFTDTGIGQNTLKSKLETNLPMQNVGMSKLFVFDFPGLPAISLLLSLSLELVLEDSHLGAVRLGAAWSSLGGESGRPSKQSP